MTHPLEQPYKELTNVIRTTQEAREVITGLEEVMTALFSTEETLDQALKQHIPLFVGQELQNLITQKHIPEERKAELRPMFSDIANYVRTLPHISLTISFSPSDNVVTVLSQWVKENLSPRLLLEITVNRQLLGGTIIVCNGIYRDFSLKALLAETWKNKRQAFEQLFI